MSLSLNFPCDNWSIFRVMELPKGEPLTIFDTSNDGRNMFWKVVQRNEHVCQWRSFTMFLILLRSLAHRSLNDFLVFKAVSDCELNDHNLSCWSDSFFSSSFLPSILPHTPSGVQGFKCPHPRIKKHGFVYGVVENRRLFCTWQAQVPI